MRQESETEARRYFTPRAYDDSVYQWHIGKVQETLTIDGKEVPNPAIKSAIFVVHGMGTQKWAETASILRSGFEDVLDELFEIVITPLKMEDIRPPFIQEGYWVNYDDIEKTFPEDWKNLEETKREFFVDLWKKRTKSILATYRWFLIQQFKLIHPRVIYRLNLFAWLLYIPLQIVSFTVLTLLALRYPRVITQVLGDVRLYLSPKGIVERAIVQRIDRRIGEQFLKIIGLDWNFLPLDPTEKIKRNGKPIEFERIIWVAHSLGSVISYNVLSDLFHRADELEKDGSPEQKDNVKKFRRSLKRFITIGSPLDKVAFLFEKEKKQIRPFPNVPRNKILDSNEEVKENDKTIGQDWWINFYHVLDPVSGALSQPQICGDKPPINYHIKLLKLPGLAHIAYWHDKITLRFILSRVYGKDFIILPPEKPYSATTLTIIAFIGNTIWAAIILGLLYVILFHGIEILKFIFKL